MSAMTSKAFALTEAQQAFIQGVRDVAIADLQSLAEAGAPGRVNRELLTAMGKHGLLARLFGGEDSGRAAAAMDLCLLRETLATVTTEAETALALQGLGSYPFLLSAAMRWSIGGAHRWSPATPSRRSPCPSRTPVLTPEH